MSKNIITALDIGTSSVQTAIAEQKRADPDFRILGLGISESAGMRRGAVADLNEVTESVRRSLEEARRAAGVSPSNVWLAIGGSHISVNTSRGVVAVSRADGEISPEDVKRAIAAAGTFVPKNLNKEVLHMIPRDFKVDYESGVKDPVGMHGVRLEADTLIIESSSQFLKGLFKCLENADLKVEDYIFGPLAASDAVLTKRQKELGVMLLDIGGGTASFVVYEEGVPIHAGVIPIGGSHITGDIAIGFRVQPEVAERVKITYGSCLPDELSKKENVKLADFIPEETAVYSRRELAEIIEARLGDIFELLQKELKKIDRDQLLPAGVVLVGGSSLIPGLVELTKKKMKLPAELGQPQVNYNFDEKIAPALATVLGVLKLAQAQSAAPAGFLGGKFSGAGKNPVSKWLKALLP